MRVLPACSAPELCLYIRQPEIMAWLGKTGVQTTNCYSSCNSPSSLGKQRWGLFEQLFIRGLQKCKTCCANMKLQIQLYEISSTWFFVLYLDCADKYSACFIIHSFVCEKTKQRQVECEAHTVDLCIVCGCKQHMNWLCQKPQRAPRQEDRQVIMQWMLSSSLI